MSGKEPCLDHHTDADAGDGITLANLADLGELVDRRRREHRNIENGTTLDALHQCADGIVVDAHAVLAVVLEISGGRENNLLHGPGGQHLHIVGARRPQRGAKTGNQNEPQATSMLPSHSMKLFSARAPL